MRARTKRPPRLMAGGRELLRLITYHVGELFRAESRRAANEILHELEARRATHRQWVSVLVVGEAFNRSTEKTEPFFGAVGDYGRPGDEIVLQLHALQPVRAGALVVVVGAGTLVHVFVGMYEQGCVVPQGNAWTGSPIIRTREAMSEGVQLSARVRVLEP